MGLPWFRGGLDFTERLPHFRSRGSLGLDFFLFVEKNYLGRRYPLEQTPSQDSDFLGFDRGVLLGVFPVFHGVTQSVV